MTIGFTKLELSVPPWSVPAMNCIIKSARCDRSALTAFPASPSRPPPAGTRARRPAKRRRRSLVCESLRSAIHDGHNHDPSVVEIGAADVLAESKGLVGGDHPTMLRNGVVGRLAEFLGLRAKGRSDNVFHRNLSDVDVPEPAGFC